MKELYEAGLLKVVESKVAFLDERQCGSSVFINFDVLTKLRVSIIQLPFLDNHNSPRGYCPRCMTFHRHLSFLKHAVIQGVRSTVGDFEFVRFANIMAGHLDNVPSGTVLT